MKHTPTPWHTSHDDRGWAIVEGADIGNGTNLFLMSDWGHRNKKGKLDRLLTNEIAAANAEFIVRAVNNHDELLAACSKLQMVAEAWIDEHVESTSSPAGWAQEILDASRAAIAKAEGESP